MDSLTKASKNIFDIYIGKKDKKKVNKIINS